MMRLTFLHSKNPSLMRLVCTLLLLVLLAGCGPLPARPIPTATHLMVTATTTQTPAPTLIATPIYENILVSVDHSGKWHFSKPYVFEDWPALIVPDDEGGYRLEEEDEIQSIELSYQWWGMGDPGFSYQKIKRSGSGYVMHGKSVSKEKVEN